jgi:hypothetical protein
MRAARAERDRAAVAAMNEALVQHHAADGLTEEFRSHVLGPLSRWNGEKGALVLPFPPRFSEANFTTLQRLAEERGYTASVVERTACRCDRGSLGYALRTTFTTCGCPVEKRVCYRSSPDEAKIK